MALEGVLITLVRASELVSGLAEIALAKQWKGVPVLLQIVSLHLQWAVEAHRGQQCWGLFVAVCNLKPSVRGG